MTSKRIDTLLRRQKIRQVLDTAFVAGMTALVALLPYLA